MVLEMTMADAIQAVVVDTTRTTCEVGSQQDELERLAVQELVNEAKRAKERSQTLGSYAWAKRKVTTNKRFLHSTLVSTLREYRTDSRQRHRSFTQDLRVDPGRSRPAVDADVTAQPDLPSTTLDEKKNNTQRPSRAALLEREQSGRHDIKGDTSDLSSRGKSEEPGRPRNYHDHHYSERMGKHTKFRRSFSPANEKTDRHGSKKSRHKKKHKHDDRHSGTTSYRKTKKHKRNSCRSPNM